MPFFKKEKPIFLRAKQSMSCHSVLDTESIKNKKFFFASNPLILQSSNLLNRRAQTLIEALIVCMLITVLMFGLIQVCIMVVDDMLYNEVSFSATRAVAVTKQQDIQKFSKQTVNKLLIASGLVSGLLFADIEQDGRDSDDEKTKNTNNINFKCRHLYK